jgi:hypothetical protein
MLTSGEVCFAKREVSINSAISKCKDDWCNPATTY